jgi:uncharacterized membrane protein
MRPDSSHPDNCDCRSLESTEANEREYVGALFGLLSALSIGFSDLFGRRVVRAGSALTAAVVLSVVAIGTSVIAVVLFGSTMRGTDLLLGLASGIGLGIGLATYYGG